MNKKLISAAVLLGVSGAATAMNVNPDGMGQVLLFPYYTVNGGKSTNIHIVNTSDTVKAVKVRFSEGVNTWEVLDFNLYLSPYDVWAGGLSMVNGAPTLYTSDTSCTMSKVPSFADGGVALRTTNIDAYGANGTGSATIAAGPTMSSETALGSSIPTAAERLTEGHIEVIDMGSMTLQVGVNDDLYNGIVHVNGVPPDCSVLSTAWNGSATTKIIPNWKTNPSTGFVAPTVTTANTLFGTAEIIDVPNGISRGYNATAIANFIDDTKTAAGSTVAGVAHAVPGDSYPNLNGDVKLGSNIGSLTTAYVDTATGIPGVATFTNPIDALSASLMATNVNNEYFIDSNYGAGTDWVLTFPTKHYYVNPLTTADGIGAYGSATYNPGTSSWDYKAPFASGYGVPVTINAYDNEEGTITVNTDDFSPKAPTLGQSISYEVNVIEFAKNHSVLNSYLANNINGSLSTFTSGWANIGFTGAGLDSVDTPVVAFKGVPVIGFAAEEQQNGQLGGGTVLANYSTVYPHKYVRDIQ